MNYEVIIMSAYKCHNIIELLYMIKQKPGLYIGYKSLQRLRCFIDGYRFAMKCEGIDYDVITYNNFNEWIADKYNIREPILWDRYLLDLSNNNQDVAFDLFFENLEIYVNDNNIKISDNKK